MAVNINHSVIVDYFKYLQENLSGLNGFYRMNLVEIKGAFRSSANFPCMVVESPDGDLGDSNVMQTMNSRTFAFTIYDNPKKADFDDENKKLTECELTGLKIIGRMRHDASNPSHFLYNHFKAESVNYAKVGPVFNEKLYGFRFIGQIEAPQPITINPEDWNDIEEICN